MSEDEREGNKMEPPSVEIPLDDRMSDRSSRKSSASTSSFEDLNTVRLKKSRRRSGQSYHSSYSDRSEGPAAVEVGDILAPNIEGDEASDTTPLSKGRLAFKKSSFDEHITIQAQNTSRPASPNLQSQRASLHSVSPKPNQKAGKPKSKNNKVKGKKGSNKGDRDPENVNGIVKIDFEEIFAEPEGTYSFGTIWGATYRIFTDSKIWCYKFLSALCGVPCALCWGLHFACLSFCMIWYYQPSIRSFSIQVKPLQKVYGVIVTSFVEPCFTALGKMFGNIRVRNSKY